MSDAKHTPGPWEADLMADRYGDWYEIAGPMAGRTGTVADTLNRDHAIDPDEGRANAHLIKASPVLLEACRAALDFLEQPFRDEDRTICLAEHLGPIGGTHARRLLAEALSLASGGPP